MIDKYVTIRAEEEISLIDQCGSKARKRRTLINAEQAFRRFFKG